MTYLRGDMFDNLVRGDATAVLKQFSELAGTTTSSENHAGFFVSAVADEDDAMLKRRVMV